MDVVNNLKFKNNNNSMHEIQYYKFVGIKIMLHGDKIRQFSYTTVTIQHFSGTYLIAKA